MNMGSLMHLTRRVTTRAGYAAPWFSVGIVLRTAERVLDGAPVALCALWLASAWPGGAPAWVPVLGWLDVLGWLLACLAMQWLCGYLGQRLTFLSGYRIMAAYRARLLNRLHQLPIGQLQQRRGGELTEQLTDDIKKVEAIFTHLVPDMVSAVLSVALVWLALAWLDIRLALALTVTLPLAAGVLHASKRFFLSRGRDKQQAMAGVSGLLIEFVLGLRTLRLFNRTASWLERLNGQFQRIRTLSLGVEAWGGGSVMMYRLVLETGLPGLLLGLAWQVHAEGAVGAHVLIFLLLAHKLYQPLLEVAETLTILRYVAQCEQRLENLLAMPAMPEPAQPRQPDGVDIRFEGVSFAYEREPVLRELSFHLPAGSLTAVVGPSGSGKTTLLNLLARFYDPDQGSVQLGGVDVRQLGADVLYAHLGMVFQHVQLHQGSIADNVALGRPDADRAAVEAACRDAGCEAFIRRLPAGYDTQIGEGGMQLSGGERQRLSIARALLKDAPVLLLDEATASVDPLSQTHIQHALTRLARGRTVLMIAHRLGTVVQADQILVLDQGRLVDQGRHEALLARCPLYQQLWRAQCAPTELSAA